MVSGSVLAPIPAGAYCVTVTDANLCEKDTCLMLDNPPQLQMNIIATNDAPCFGTDQGSIVVSAVNGFMGTQFFNYIIYDVNGNEYTTANGAGDLMIPNIEQGQYTILVTDGQCAAIEEIPFTINEATEITIDEITSTINTPSCFGFCDGSITVAATGGIAPYSYTWVSNGLVSPVITNLCGNQFHYIDIEDDNGCIKRDSIFLDEPSELMVTLDPNASFGPSCSSSNGGLGLITLSVVGGTAPYNYDWQNDISTTNSAPNLSPGIYNVTVTDDNNCSAVFTEELTSPPPIVASYEIPEPPKCPGEQVCLTVIDAFGGSGNNYSFTVNGSAQFPIDSCVNVFPGTFSIKVYDGTGFTCFTDTTIIIASPNQLAVDLGSDVLEVALGDSSVVLQANVQSINPVDFIWESLGDFECLDPLCQIISVYPTEATSYSVTVIDSDGCEASDKIQILIGEDRLVYIPNIFSPNGDGYNDKFGVYVGSGVENIELFSIYDRWGNLVFETKNLDPDDAQFNQWDGKLNLEHVVPGIYVYLAKVNFIDDTSLTYKGSLTLVK